MPALKTWNDTTWINVKADPNTHAHPIADVTNLQTTLDGKAPTMHSHAIADVTNLQTSLDGKAPTSHIHAIEDTTGLQSALDEKVSGNITITAPLPLPRRHRLPMIYGSILQYKGRD
jgi:hypothetical protein